MPAGQYALLPQPTKPAPKPVAPKPVAPPVQSTAPRPAAPAWQPAPTAAPSPSAPLAQVQTPGLAGGISRSSAPSEPALAGLQAAAAPQGGGLPDPEGPGDQIGVGGGALRPQLGQRQPPSLAALLQGMRY